jgi:lipopolysaccharide transport system permease protein
VRSPTADAIPITHIRPISGWQAIDLWELWQYRDLLLVLVGRDITLRYRQTALGVVWVVGQPMLGALIFAFVFGRIAGLKSEGTSYFVFAYLGLLAWNLFSTTVNRASGSLVANAQLVSKIYFPRVLLPLSACGSNLVDFAVGLLLVPVFLLSGMLQMSTTMLLAPLWIALVLCLALGLGLFAAAVMVRFRDVAHVLPVMLQLLLYASPVGYGLSAVPEGWRALYLLNPLASLIEAFRAAIVGSGGASAPFMAYSALVSLAALVAGALFLRRQEADFADVI